MTRSLVLPVTLLVLSAAICAARAEKFDGGKAYEHVRQLVAIGPRPPGSPGLERTRQYVKDQLKAVGLTVTEQAFDADTPLGRMRMVNLIARIPGQSPERILFAGHYETKLFREFRFVGANDAGSSTAFLLELGRVLEARQNRYTIELVFFDGEESLLPEWESGHTYGSRHYVKAASAAGTLAQVRAMILLDMIGDRDLRIMREAGSTRWLTDLVWAAAKRLGQDHIFVDESTPIEDDHMPFVEAGVPAVDIIDLEYLPYWHTKDDTLDKVSARSMQVVGEVVLEALPAIESRLAKTPAAGR